MISRRRSVMAGATVLTVASGLAAARSAVAAEPDMGLRTKLPTPVPMTEALADLGNVKLWYWDTGGLTGGLGEVVVFLHPGSGSAEFFPYQQPAFAKAGYRVISHSRRGQFKSEMGSDSDKFFAADDLLALMDHLKVGKFHAVGSALGGYIGLDVALSQPERLQSLVLASSMMGIAEPDYQKTLEALRPKPFGELPIEVQEVGPSYRVANPEGLAEWKARHDRSGKRAPVRLRNKFTWETLGKLKVPTLLMTGDADLWIPPFLLREVGEKIPSSTVVIVSDAGHAIQWERPEAFNAAVLGFIRSNATR
jgi:pimeloyl-ACP methyl ester carboxylesterase